MFTGKYIFCDNNFLVNEPKGLWQPLVDMYEVFRIINSVPIFLDDHLTRLENSCRKKGISFINKRSNLKEIIRELMSRNEIENGNIRISIDIGDVLQSMAVGQVEAFYPTNKIYKDGVYAQIVSAEREFPEVKIYQSTVRSLAETVIAKTGAYDVILVNGVGQLTEGSRTNLFFVKNNKVVTAPKNLVLHGITRGKVLTICEELGLELSVAPAMYNSIMNFDAAFFTGTSPKVLPICQINDVKYNADNQVVRSIQQSFNQLIEEEIKHFRW